ncbi:MAG: hypothetical protein V3U64_04250 [Cocleimonas sp.]
MLRILALSFTLMASMMFSTNVSACDTEACKIVNNATSKQYSENRIRKAKAVQAERRAYSKNRERRAYARYVHNYVVSFGFGL